jgi:TonB family protein
MRAQPPPNQGPVGASPAPPASSAAPAAPPAPTPPVALAPLTAAYPAGQQGDASVILEIVVDAKGAVQSAVALSGSEPFAAAAIAASSSWRFRPATRAGAPVAARVRAQIAFKEEKQEAPPVPKPAAEPPAREKPKPPQTLEVTIVGEQLAPAVTSLSRAEVRLLPGAFGDPFRAIEAMPGVTPIASGIPYFYVRGAPPGNVGYFLDGIRVPILYHLGLGPSVIHPAIVERVDLYPGGYPARFGRFAGGIVAGETKPPATDWHGEANVRIVDAGAFLEAPFAGGRGAALAGGRYSYTALLLSLVAPGVDLAYWDYQARASYELTPRDRVTAFAFGSYDRLANTERGVTTTIFDTTFHRLDLRYDHKLGDGGTLRHAITLGYDLTKLDLGRSLSTKSLASRTEVVRKISDDVVVRFGADGVLEANDVDLLRRNGGDINDFLGLFSTRSDLQVGLRGDAVIQVTPRFEVTPGVRVDLFGSGGKTALGLDPRLAARVAITKDLRLVQAHGVASQMPSFFLPGPGFQPDLEGGLQRSFQSSAGIEVDLPEDVSATLTFFRVAFFNMTDPLGTVPTQGDLVPEDFNVRTGGQTAGIELSIRRRLTRKLGGFLSYTLSRSTRSFGESTVPSSFDRTHVVNLAASYNFGRGYYAGGRVVFYTGAPALGDPEGGRLPPFFRLDLRLEKRWTIFKRGWISLVLEGLNVSATKETVAVDCQGVNPARPGVECENETIGPVAIPSLGVEAGF